jgi:uncharacterized protein (TIGR03435 family)
MTITRQIPFVALSVVFGIVGVHAIQAQSPAPAGTNAAQFDEVTIKPCIPGDEASPRKGRVGETISANSLRLECRTVKSLIQEAFINGGKASAEFGPRTVIQWQAGGHASFTTQTAMTAEPNLRLIREPLEGGPDWLDTDLYSIEAKSEKSQDVSMITGPMLQAILEDRFKVRVHPGKKEVPVYVLELAQEGSRLRTAAEGSCASLLWDHPQSPGARSAQPSCGVFRSTGSHAIEALASMANLCAQFSVWLDRDVADKTGLSGMFQVHLPFPAEDLKPGPLTRELSGSSGTASAMHGSSHFQLLSNAAQGLGLKLEAGTDSSDVLIVDQVERPSGN